MHEGVKMRTELLFICFMLHHGKADTLLKRRRRLVFILHPVDVNFNFFFFFFAQLELVSSVIVRN